ncbi:MAG: hypothetical protein ACFNVK_02675, partial [Prevotella sp.]
MKFRQISGAYPLRFWPFTMLLHFSLKKNSPKFASATTRTIELKDKRIVSLTDTVGFIQKIEKQTTLTAKVTPKAWKNCNSLTTRF